MYGATEKKFVPVPSQQTTVVQTMVAAPVFRELPVMTICPNCHTSITTVTRFETGTLTWIIFGVMLLLGLWLGCCLIPFYVDGCKDCIHTCPNCQNTVGKYSRL